MMTDEVNRDWKPGDVVTATVNGRPTVRVIAGWSRYEPQLRWGELSTRWADGDDDQCWFMPSQVTDHRPLVVIDPEDREQVGRLAWLIFEKGGTPGAVVRAALREFADPKPPKPEEPLALGAVVESADGRVWTRYDTMGDPQPWWCDDQGPDVPVERRFAYADTQGWCR